MERTDESRIAAVKEILGRTGALLLDSHFVYTSGRHGSAYINKDAVYPHTADVSRLCFMMASGFQDQGVEAVVGPALGGIILSNNTATAMRDLTGQNVLGVYAEKAAGGGFQFTRGYGDLVVGKRTLIVEDLLTTGGSANDVVRLCRATGAEVVGLAVLANRGSVTSEGVGGVPLRSLIDFEMTSTLEEDCGLCVAEIPIDTRVGKGREYLRSKGLL